MAFNAPSSPIGKFPKIINRNALTYATPTTELKYFRHASDSIGNNYTPNAKNLTAKLLWSTNKLKNGNSLKDIPSLNQKPKPGLVNLSSLSDMKSVSKYSSLNSFKSDIFEEPQLSELSTGTFDQTERSLSIDTNQLVNSKLTFNQYLFYTSDNNRLEFVHNNSAKVEKLFALLMGSNMSIPQTNRSSLRTTPLQPLKKKLKKSTFSPKNDDFGQSSSDDQVALEVMFPPWYNSTHGLSRPNSPDELSKQRYIFLLENCLEDKSILNRITQETKLNILNLIVTSGMNIEKYNKLIESCFQEANEYFNWSFKKSIIDYVLKDDAEQKRLDVKMIKKVGF